MTSSERIELVSPSLRFKHMFSEERLALAIVLGNRAQAIEHIGSTAIEGICAKPIVDILVGMREPLNVAIEPLTSAGYVYSLDPEQQDRLVFWKGVPRTFHVHVTQFDGPEWRRHIVFRDWLNLHSDIAKEYEALKQDLARRFADDRAAYTNGKTEFCHRIEREAAKFPALRLLR